VHNGERFLREALDSVLGQTYRDLELIVVDDGSTDSTPSILSSYADERLHVIALPRVGLVEALNRGVGRARGRFIARMDADDGSLPLRIERQAELLDRRGEVGLVATWVAVVDEQGREVERRVLPGRHADLRRRLLLRNPFQHGSVMFRREVFDRVGPYRDDYGHNEDYDLWRRVARTYELATVPEVLYRYRVHGAAVTQVSPDRVRLRELLRDELWREFDTAAYGVRDTAVRLRGYRRGDRRVYEGVVADQRALAREAFGRRRYALAAEALFVSLIAWR
jgi:glycosyltransferase involved in cell wall biosynthesis